MAAASAKKSPAFAPIRVKFKEHDREMKPCLVTLVCLPVCHFGGTDLSRLPDSPCCSYHQTLVKCDQSVMQLASPFHTLPLPSVISNLEPVYYILVARAMNTADKLDPFRTPTSTFLGFRSDIDKQYTYRDYPMVFVGAC